MKHLYLFGNWKMYLDFEESFLWAKQLAERMKDLPTHITSAVFPSAISLKHVKDVLEDSPVEIGAQIISSFEKGAYTGEVSAAMCRSVGVTYALIGHSERRHLFHETANEIRLKIEHAYAARITPVICVGETLSERQAGKTDEIIMMQIQSALHALTLPPEPTMLIAYEPVWAINTGEACDPREAERVHKLIKRSVNDVCGRTVPTAVVYGGSVNPQNIESFLAEQSIEGVLVGGGSVKAHDWFELVSKMGA